MTNINEFINFLVCPITKNNLVFDSKNQRLVNKESKLAYPVIDGIPILLAEKAIELEDKELENI